MIGKTPGHYQIIEKFGEGGRGVLCSGPGGEDECNEGTRTSLGNGLKLRDRWNCNWYVPRESSTELLPPDAAPRDPASFNPVELGIGLRLTNGLGWGLVVGVLLVAIIAWKETRLARKEAQDAVTDSIKR